MAFIILLVPQAMQEQTAPGRGVSHTDPIGVRRRAIDPLLELPGVRPSLRWLRRAPSRLLHPMRRRAAIRRLREGGPPRSVLFVCIGNIFRSPYAAYRFQAALPEPLRQLSTVASAGFVGPDRPSPASAVELAATQGIDLTPHRSALLTQEAISGAELIVVMDEVQVQMIRSRYGIRPGQHVLVLGDLDPEPIVRRGIVDPWDQQGDVLAECYARVDRCVDTLILALGDIPADLSDGANDAL